MFEENDKNINKYRGRKLILLNYDQAGKCPNYEEYLNRY